MFILAATVMVLHFFSSLFWEKKQTQSDSDRYLGVNEEMLNNSLFHIYSYSFLYKSI